MIDPRELVQIEIPVTDFEQSKEFYRNVFGWVDSPAGLHECVIFAVPEGCPYGVSLVPRETDQVSRGITPYFKVDEVGFVLHNAPRYGGAVTKGPIPLPGYGVLHHISDPDGNIIGILSKK